MFRNTGHALLLVLAAIFVFHSPFTRWWSENNLPWYTVFVFWLVLIILVALDNIKRGSDSRHGKDRNTDQSKPNGD